MTHAALRTALAAGAALLVAACGGGDSTDNAANEVDSNLMFEEPANDASALESAYNATEPLPPANDVDAGEDIDAIGETSGGDTAGNTVDSNVAGM
jgi:hypothetical protein